MLFKEFGGVDAFPICLDTKDPDAIVATVKAIAPTFGGINLEDISRPALLRDRGAAEGRASTSRSSTTTSTAPRSSSLAALLNAIKLTGKRSRTSTCSIVGLGAAGVAVDEDPARRRRAARDRLRLQGRAARPTASRLPGRLDDADQALVRRDHQPGAALRRPRRRDRGRRPVHRPLRRARDARRGARADGRRRDGVRDGQPDARGHARGGRAVRAHHRHRPLGLPEPDQQRALLPRASSAARSTSARARSPRR